MEWGVCRFFSATISIVALLMLSISCCPLNTRELVVATVEMSGAIEKGRAHAVECSAPQRNATVGMSGASTFVCGSLLQCALFCFTLLGLSRTASGCCEFMINQNFVLAESPCLEQLRRV